MFLLVAFIPRPLTAVESLALAYRRSLCCWAVCNALILLRCFCSFSRWIGIFRITSKTSSAGTISGSSSVWLQALTRSARKVSSTTTVCFDCTLSNTFWRYAWYPPTFPSALWHLTSVLLFSILAAVRSPENFVDWNWGPWFRVTTSEYPM